MTKALALVSGGLDSILAACLIREQGIEVTAICFKSAFFSSKNAEKICKYVGIPLVVVDFTDEHLEMTKDPKYGYGKNMNPCIDCHAMMMRHAGRLLEEMNADFLITGEVLNQRPMSQNRRALDIVKKESGWQKKILRPLCAKCLLPTEMELEGLVDREKLLDFSGRTRKPQMALAKTYGILEYPSPAGGCCLTEPQFGNRLRNLYESGKEEITSHDVELLKIGRHIDAGKGVKVISTRDSGEYDQLMNLLRDRDYVFNTAECNGSTIGVILLEDRDLTQDEINFAAGVTARYSKDRENPEVAVKYKRIEDETEVCINAVSETDEKLQEMFL